MTSMEATLGFRDIHPFGHLPEPLSNPLARKHQLTILLQTQNLWFSHTHLCNVHHKFPDDHVHRLCRQRGVVTSTLSASSIAVPTSPEESTFKLAAENAYNSPSIEPHVLSLLEFTPPKSHLNKRRHFLPNGASVFNGDSQGFLEENSALASEGSISYSSEAVVMCFKCLELTGMCLRKCLKHASSVSEDDVLSLLKMLSSYGFSRSEIKSMFAKYPPLVKVQALQVEQCFQYYSGLEFSKSVVAALFLKRPALLAFDLKRASQVIEYLLSIGMRKEDLSSIIACRPHIFEHDVAILKSIVSALMKAGLDQTEINKLIKRSPNIFTPSLEDIERSLSFWSNVGVEGKSLYRAILRRPNMLSYDTASMLTTYKYLEWWFDRSDLTKLVSRFAELLAYDPQTKLKPLIDYFLELGLSEGEVAKVILRRPQLMTCTLERLKRVAGFLSSLGMKDDMVGKVLITSPQVFTLNTDDKLKRGVEFFRAMGLKKEKDLEYLFVRSAQLFCCSIEKNLQPTIKFFSDMGLEKEDLTAMIVAFPSMLGQSIELSLAPKYQYLVGEMKRTNKELVEFPQYFGYSLEGRIKPRHTLLSERGLHKSLPSMLACTDSDFLKRYIEAYSPLPRHIVQIGDGDPRETVSPQKKKTRRKKAVVVTSEVLAEPIQQEPLPAASQHQKFLMANGPEVLVAEGQPDAMKETVSPQKQKTRRKKAVVPISEVLAEPIQQEPLPVASEQEAFSITNGSGVPVAEDQTDAMKEEWEFLNFIPQLQQSQLYPASFRKHYKNLTPCGKWIHAYKFDT